MGQAFQTVIQSNKRQIARDLEFPRAQDYQSSKQRLRYLKKDEGQGGRNEGRNAHRHAKSSG
jgi:hypothetical protein